MQLVGRHAEREQLARALAAGRGVVVIEGEPGIGKSALLAWVAERARARGLEVRGGRASEYEVDLPYALWREAIGTELPRGDRHQAHAALRAALAALGGAVVCLDDLHWADPASLDALAALVRRPPEAPVLLVLAARRDPGLPADVHVVLAPLTEAEAAELVGAAAPAVYPVAGGNPFYLLQLARAAGGAVPPTLAAALAAELGTLSPDARRLLDGAAIAGDPFEVGLAAAAAEVVEPLPALDELLAAALVRPTDVPRRFAFRHPVVRHAVYAAAPGGWRLGAHARAAEALGRAGAGLAERAHHVEQAAAPGDEAAVALLAAAARELQSPAPAAAARFYAAALRLTGDGDRRAELQGLLADALAAAGDPAAARATLLDALRTAPAARRLVLTVGVANVEWWLGREEDARRRLQVTLGEQPAEPSADRIRLRLSLAIVALSSCDISEALAQVSDARADAEALGEPVFAAAAMALGALAGVSAGGGAAALEESTAAFARLSEAEQATRLPAFWMHGRARAALGQFDAALRELRSGSAVAARTGRLTVRLLLTVESVAVLVELGRIPEAVAVAEEGVELARLAGIPRVTAWARSALSGALLAAGDVGGATREAGAARAIGAAGGFHAAGQPAWCEGNALAAAGNAERAVPRLEEALRAALPVQRPLVAADLEEARLARGDAEAAAAALADGAGSPAGGDGARAVWPAALTGAGRAAVLLARGQAAEAAALAAAARGGAPPLTRARARLLEGRALAALGERSAAVAALAEAEAELDRCGALRRRDEAVRELRRLGHRVLRASRDPAAGPLTGREREIAELAAAGRTNREIAEQLVLSTRTIEAHLRNVYAKLGVRSRIELTRALADLR